MKIVVVGCGYVGLVTGACFAEFGHEVVCIDVDGARIANLADGRVPIYEPGLAEIVRHNLQRSDRRLSFTSDLCEAIIDADAVFICVGTPQAEDGAADTGAVFAASRAVAAAAKRPTVIAVKSTVPVGTSDAVNVVVQKTAPCPISVVSNPEFLKEGDAVRDFMRCDRVVVGASGAAEVRVMEELYRPMMTPEARLIVTDRCSAELIKYASNAMLATRVSLMNEFALLCDATGADIHAVRQGVGSDTRIGERFLYAGPGFGGSCFSKDLAALVRTGFDRGFFMEIPEAVLRVNERQKHVLAGRIAEHFGGLEKLRNRTVAVWGLSFKAETDDVRESPAVALVQHLVRGGARVRAYDPHARVQLPEGAERLPSAMEAAQGAEALALMTEWREFRQPDFARLKRAMAQPAVFDGRNIWDPAELRALGFTYSGIGRR